MQAVRADEAKHSPWKSPQARAAMVVAVALAAAGASFTFISQDASDVAGAALAVGSVVTVAIAWVTIGPLFAARLLAVGQGMVWFFLLIHGGLGLVVGPAGWAASVSGKRAPRLASALLAGPAALLIVSWLPVVLGPEGVNSRERLALAALIAPAVVAAVILLRANLHAEESVT